MEGANKHVLKIFVNLICFKGRCYFYKKYA